MGFTAFFEPISEEFGWSYTQISLAASFRGFELGMLAPLVGLLVDRLGSRKLFVIGLILIGCGLLFLSRIQSLAMYYAAFVLIAVGVSGTSITAIMATASNWFHEKLGVVTGILNSGVALSGLLVPVIVKVIDSFGWRNAVLYMAVAIWVIGIPLAMIIRHRPEPYGYLPYGSKYGFGSANFSVSPTGEPQDKTSLKQALSSRAFWHIGIALMLMFAATSSINAHSMPFLSSIGVDRSTASLVAMSLAIISIGGRFGSGWLVDKYSSKTVSIFFSASVTLGMIMAVCISSVALWVVVPFILFSSSGWGANTTLRVSLTNAYFGRGNFGTIFGFLMGLVAIGQVLGPLFAGWVFDTFHSYHFAWISFAVIAFISVVILMTMPPLPSSEVPAASKA